MYVKLVENGIGVLSRGQRLGERSFGTTKDDGTLLKLAVKTTISYSSPIFLRKLSTPGRLIT
jgi:hypothetical protein